MTDAEHRIEETVKVYLEWDGDEWKVSGPTVDGHTLDSDHGGATCDFTHEQDSSAEQECESLLTDADGESLPNAMELIPLIAEWLTAEEIGVAIDQLTKLLVEMVPTTKVPDRNHVIRN